jgi:hypothetical protein
MSNFLSISPVLPVANIEPEIKFFERLGFTKVYDSLQYSGKLDYAVLARSGQTIHLQWFGEHDFYGQQVKIWVQDVDAIGEEFDKRLIPYNRRDNTAWGTSEISLYSPAQPAIFFVQDLKTQPTS